MSTGEAFPVFFRNPYNALSKKEEREYSTVRSAEILAEVGEKLMKCHQCRKRCIPKSGRAAEHHLCCKCDRISFGPQSEEDKCKKIAQKKNQKKQQIIAMLEAAYAVSTRRR